MTDASTPERAPPLFRPRIDELTGLRGAASLAVVLVHARLHYDIAGAHRSIRTPGLENEWLRLPLVWSWLGVDVFFVLSGFLLGGPLVAAGRRTSGFLRDYATRRMLRIWPPYLVALALTLPLAGAISSLRVDPTLPLWHSGLSHAVYLHGWLPTHQLDINGVYWSLVLEEQFYLVLPLIAVAFRRQGHRALLLALVVSVSYVVFCARLPASTPTVPSDMFALFQFPAFLFHFAVGIYAASWIQEGRRLPGSATLWAAAAIGAGLAVGMAVRVAPLPRNAALVTQDPYVRLVVAGATGLLMVAMLQGARPWQALLRSRPMVALGTASYSLYLVHLPVVLLLAFFSPLADLHLAAFVLLATAASLVAAWIFYGLVEAPSLRWREHVIMRMRRRTAPDEPARRDRA